MADTRQAFTVRLDPDLVALLDERARAGRRSRNALVEVAVRALLDGQTVADDTRMNARDDARGTSAGQLGERARRDRLSSDVPDWVHVIVEKAERELSAFLPEGYRVEFDLSEPYRLVSTESDAPLLGTEPGTEPAIDGEDTEERHLHRFQSEVPETRRALGDWQVAMFACDCGVTIERTVK